MKIDPLDIAINYHDELYKVINEPTLSILNINSPIIHNTSFFVKMKDATELELIFYGDNNGVNLLILVAKIAAISPKLLTFRINIYNNFNKIGLDDQTIHKVAEELIKSESIRSVKIAGSKDNLPSTELIFKEHNNSVDASNALSLMPNIFPLNKDITSIVVEYIGADHHINFEVDNTPLVFHV